MSCFEGVEKLLLVSFETTLSESNSLLHVQQSKWEHMLGFAHCEILHSTKTNMVNSYVLSESSLFVYDDFVYLKTCGTTTLLNILPSLLTVAQSNGFKLTGIEYSHKNYIFPEMQKPSYRCFSDEIELLRAFLYESALSSLENDDPRKVYPQSLDMTQKPLLKVSSLHIGEDKFDKVCFGTPIPMKRVNIMMFDLSDASRDAFYSKDNDCEKVRGEMGLQGLCFSKTAELDDYLFQPCGYSMNYTEKEDFFTVHVTPEKDFSYASFETSHQFQTRRQLEAWVDAVAKKFQPGKICCVLTGYDNEKLNIERKDLVETVGRAGLTMHKFVER